MKLTFTYTAYANKKTQKAFDVALESCRALYNVALEQRICAYKSVMRKNVTCYEQIKELPSLKGAYPEFADVYSQTLQDTIERLDRAYKSFFKRIKLGDRPGHPRFKGKDRYVTLAYKVAGYKIVGRYITFSKLGTFKLQLSRPIIGKIKYITITKKSNDKFQIAFTCDVAPKQPLVKTGNVIGLDLGCTNVVTDSNGSKTKNPKFLGKMQERIGKIQKKQAIKKTSKRRKEIARLHAKVARQRKDFLHKVSRKYVNENDLICVEKLATNEIKEKAYKTIRKSATDAAWGTLLQYLRYKAEYAGRDFVEVNPKNTSKRCSACGKLIEKTLANRVHVCDCGYTEDRDVNAAKNILRAGQARL